jgi:molecular chaperone Hsp33
MGIGRMDQRVSGILKGTDLRVVLVLCTDAAREARRLHRLEPTSAALLAQGYAAAALAAALQKELTQLNLQLECDGPLRGLLVDAGSDGSLRGYAKNPFLNVELTRSEYHWRPALGNSGFLSMLREHKKGEFYRSSIELKHFDIARDLEEFFRISEQVPTAVELALAPAENEPLGVVAGVLLQALPGADPTELEKLAEAIRREQRLLAALSGLGFSPSAKRLCEALFPGLELEQLSEVPIKLQCTCSKERVLRALQTMGREELEDLLAKDGKAEADCQFCGRHYLVGPDELKAMLQPA